MSQISVIATINEPAMRQRLSINLSAFHPAITVAEVATAAEQTPLLQGYPIHNLISPPPAVTHRPLASMQLGGELQLEWQTLQGQHSSRMDELIAKMDRLEDEVISLRPLKETIASLEVEVDSLRPLKETITSLEVEVDSLRPLKTTVASLDSYVTPIRGAINDALLPMADSLAIRCLLDVFLHQQGYSQQLHGSRRDWVEDNKTKIFEATGIPEGDIERIFRCASSWISYPLFFPHCLTLEPTGVRPMSALMCSKRTPSLMRLHVSPTMMINKIWKGYSPRLYVQQLKMNWTTPTREH
jgi:hypothetical protein